MTTYWMIASPVVAGWLGWLRHSNVRRMIEKAPPEHQAALADALHRFPGWRKPESTSPIVVPVPATQPATAWSNVNVPDSLTTTNTSTTYQATGRG